MIVLLYYYYTPPTTIWKHTLISTLIMVLNSVNSIIMTESPSTVVATRRSFAFCLYAPFSASLPDDFSLQRRHLAATYQHHNTDHELSSSLH